MMAITPVVAAFGHYSDKAVQLSATQIIVAADGANDAGISASQHSDHCQPDKSHPASCSFHVCVDCGITSSFWFPYFYSADRYKYSEQSTTASFFFSPDIKPPISNL
jgi:hypothetical protein